MNARVFALGLLVFSGFAFAVDIFQNTTINSTLQGNTFFSVFPGFCVFDEATGNVYCAKNETINNTIYPICNSHANETVDLNYAGFGTAEKLNYSCFSGELVNAPPEPASVIVNETCTLNASVTPVKFEKTLSCRNEDDVKKGFRHIDFQTQQYLDFQIADCEPPVTNVSFDGLPAENKSVLCQPFYDKGQRDKLCPQGQVQAQESSPDYTLAVGLVVLAAALAYHFWQKRQIPQTKVEGETLVDLK